MADDPTPRSPSATPAALLHPRARGLTLPEIAAALVISGLLMAAILSQWLESTSLALKAAETLEHTRSTRELVFRLAEDVRNAQTLRIYPSFDEREELQYDEKGNKIGNYLVLQEVSVSEKITRTIGYYLIETAKDEWMLYRHDSKDGKLAADILPPPNTAGTHRAITRAVTLPESDNLFRSVRDRAVSMRGEFGASGPIKRGRTEFVQCTLSTRS